MEARLQRPDLHIAGYGGPGSRKSTFFATLPQPIVVAHFDAVGKDMPYWRLGQVGDVQTGKDGVAFREVVRKDGLLAAKIEYYTDFDIEHPKASSLFLERLNKLPKQIGRGECRTFCFETVTSSSLKTRKWYQYDLESGARDPRKWYGGAVDVLEEILLIQLPSMHCNVCVGLHESKTKVEAEGGLVRAPNLPGRLLESFASQWPEIYHMYVDRDRKTGDKTWLIQTQSDEKWEATTQIDAPDPSGGHYDDLWVHWDKMLRKQEKVSDIRG